MKTSRSFNIADFRLVTVSGRTTMNERWMSTDEREDILSSLKLFISSQRNVTEDDSYWKWSVISLHSAVQSAMAFHLSFGNDLLVMTQEDAEA